MSRPYRLGLAGLGAVFDLHRTAITEHPAFDLVATCDADPDRGAAFGSIGAMLEGADLDAVVVATTVGTHAPVVRAALEAGLPVLVEKPAVTRSEDLGLWDEADSLQVSLHSAHAPDVLWAAAEGLPEIVGFEASFSDPWPPSRTGDAWLELGVNALAAITAVLSRPVTLVSLERSPDRRQALAGLVFEGGVGRIEVSWAGSKNWKQTRLHFADERPPMILEHSRHRVRQADALLFDAWQGPPRLAAHYGGVYAEWLDVLRGAPDNRAIARHLHEQLLAKVSAER